MFEVRFRDTGALDRFGREIPKIARRVVVRVANEAVPVAKEAILREWNVSPEVVDAAIRVSVNKDSSWWTGSDNPRAWIIARGRRLNLLDFSAQQTSTGVSVEIKRGRRQVVPHAFITEVTRGYGRAGGQSKQAVRRVLKNLKRQRDAEAMAEKAKYASVALRRMKSSERWGEKATAFGQKYADATKRYQLQRAVLRGLGLTRGGVFIRKTRARLPIKALYGGSIQSFFASGNVTRELRRFTKKACAEYLRLEWEQLLAQTGGSSNRTA